MMTSSKRTMSEQLKNRILEFCTLLSFNYQGVECSIDPFNPHDFHVNCGGDEHDLDNIDAVMNDPLFCGKSLNEIADKIEDIEW